MIPDWTNSVLNNESEAGVWQGGWKIQVDADITDINGLSDTRLL